MDDVMDAADVEFMTRLFGPRIPGSEKQWFEDADFVVFPVATLIPSAIRDLVSFAVSEGIGARPAGWSFTEGEDGLTLSICRPTEAMAA